MLVITLGVLDTCGAVSAGCSVCGLVAFSVPIHTLASDTLTAESNGSSAIEIDILASMLKARTRSPCPASPSLTPSTTSFEISEMNLRTFIAQTLLDIVNGVTDAQQATNEGVVVPRMPMEKSVVDSGITKIQIVEIDVAVRAEESYEADGQARIGISVLGASTKGAVSATSGNESRVKVRIPLQLPTSGKLGG